METIEADQVTAKGEYEGFRKAAAGKTLKLNNCQQRLLSTNKRISIVPKQSGLI